MSDENPQGGETPQEPTNGDQLPDWLKIRDGKIILQVNGQETAYEPGDMQKRMGAVQKEEAANARFREAATLKEEAQQARAGLVELFRKAETGDADSYMQLLSESGYQGVALAEKVQAYKSQWDEFRAWEQSQGAGGQPAGGQQMPQYQPQGDPEPIGFDELDDDLKREISEARRSRHQRNQEVMEEQVEAALAEDPLISRILGKEGSKATKIRKLAKSSTLSRLRAREKWGPELIRGVVADVKAIAEEFGEDGQPTSLTGLGGGSPFPAVDVSAGKAPEPVPTTDPDYRQNVAKRLVHKLLGS